ncbi:MAG TPA: VOC family protein [Streptosporangiaceae bacterium]|nr:VOC family protein [Streptosporangiaceae bacterium]
MTLALSLMLAVPSAQAAADWYERSLGARRMWDLGSVVGLQIDSAPFFLHEPTTRFDSPAALDTTTVRVEVFCDDPDAFIARAVAAGAHGSVDEIRDHETPWGVHRQGGFTDPFGHRWLVGDKSPLEARTGD